MILQKNRILIILTINILDIKKFNKNINKDPVMNIKIHMAMAIVMATEVMVMKVTDMKVGMDMAMDLNQELHKLKESGNSIVRMFQ